MSTEYVEIIESDPFCGIIRLTVRKTGVRCDYDHRTQARTGAHPPRGSSPRAVPLRGRSLGPGDPIHRRSRRLAEANNPAAWQKEPRSVVRRIPIQRAGDEVRAFPGYLATG